MIKNGIRKLIFETDKQNHIVNAPFIGIRKDREDMADIHQYQIKWVKTWQKAALSLKNVKRNELKAYDYYEKNHMLLDEMLQYACDNSKKRVFSGLVEQQRIFKKMNKNKR